VLAAGAAPPDADTDGDGVSDELEIALGTDPFDANSVPAVNAKAPLPLNIKKLGISLNFAIGGRDGIALSGVLPIPAGFVFAGQKIGIEVGGVVRSFTLNAKGKAKVGTNSFAIGIKPKLGLSKYTMKVSRGTFSDRLQDEKLTNTTVKALPVTVIVNLIFNNTFYQKAQPQSYTARQGKTGKAK